MTEPRCVLCDEPHDDFDCCGPSDLDLSHLIGRLARFDARGRLILGPYAKDVPHA